MRPRKSALPVAILFLGGCVGLGWRFGPWFSSNNKDLFSEPPVVVQRGEQFFLSWTQGSNPFFFMPDYKAMDGRLVFVLASTTSSGNLAGRYREMKIEGDQNIVALHRGGVYWWEPEPEPDGSFVRLQIVKQSPVEGLAVAVDARAGEEPASEQPASKPAPPAKRKRHRAKEEDARGACLEECKRRNTHTDCADADGHMMPCPCHCD